MILGSTFENAIRVVHPKYDKRSNNSLGGVATTATHKELVVPDAKPVSQPSSLVWPGLYAGAVARGPDIHVTPSPKQTFIDVLLEDQAPKILGKTEVEEDEPEGFGLKKKYFEQMERGR